MKKYDIKTTDTETLKKWYHLMVLGRALDEKYLTPKGEYERKEIFEKILKEIVERFNIDIFYEEAKKAIIKVVNFPRFYFLHLHFHKVYFQTPF